MDTSMIDYIGNMMVNIIMFVMNLSPGYILIMVMLFIGTLVIIFFDNFKRFIIAPKY